VKARGIHQIVAGASPGDAITNLALELRALFRQVGPSEIYARHIAPPLQGDIRRIADYRPAHSANVLVYHASIGEPETHAVLMARSEPIVLVYHNFTPPSFFESYDPAFADLLALGSLELRRLRPRVAAAIAVSEFNAAELRALGYRDVRVAPPVIDADSLTEVEPHGPTLNHLDHAFDGPILVAVGQVLPHKRPDYLVRAMHVAMTYRHEPAYLLLVGQQRLASYVRVVREQIRELNLPHVHLVGPVSDAELAAYYRRASALVSASEHEGFCVPMLEAMAFGVPIVARSFAAVPETVGDAALLLPPDAGPTLFAEAVGEITTNDALRSALVARGRARRAHFDSIDAKAKYLQTVLEVV